MKPRERPANPADSHLRTVTLATKVGPVASVVATPEGAWTSGVVVIADHDGLDESVLADCRRLAANGHAAVAIELNAAHVDDALDAQSAELLSLTHAVSGALSYLRSSAPAPLGRLGVVGYGTGGFVALAAGYRCQVGVAVSLYGKGPMLLRKHLTQLIEKPKPHAASFLCLVGGADEDVCPDDLRAIRAHLTAFGMRHTFIVYPRTRGGFLRPERPTYREREAADAWDKVLRALETAPRLRHRFASKPLPPVTSAGAAAESAQAMPRRA